MCVLNLLVSWLTEIKSAKENVWTAHFAAKWWGQENPNDERSSESEDGEAAAGGTVCRQRIPGESAERNRFRCVCLFLLQQNSSFTTCTELSIFGLGKDVMKCSIIAIIKLHTSHLCCCRKRREQDWLEQPGAGHHDRRAQLSRFTVRLLAAAETALLQVIACTPSREASASFTMCKK